MSLMQRIFNFPRANPVRTLQSWFQRPEPPLGMQPDFGTLDPNPFKSPNFNGSQFMTVPQTQPRVFPKSMAYGGLTTITIPRPGP